MTLRRDSVTWSRAQRQFLDGSEQLRSRESNMTTPTTHQVSLRYLWDISILNSQPPLHLFIFLHTCTPTLLFLPFSTFPIPFTRQRKQNHSRSEQSCLPAQSNLPGNEILYLGNFGINNHRTTAGDVFLAFSLNRWVSTIMLGRNMDIFRSSFRITHWVRARRFGKTPHEHRWECGRGRRLCFPAITVFRSVTFRIYYNRVLYCCL